MSYSGHSHPQQHSGRVGESNGQISWFWVVPPSLLLHREDGEDHLEGAQDLDAQSLSRIHLQGDLGWEKRVAEELGTAETSRELTLLTKCSAVVSRGRAR